MFVQQRIANRDQQMLVIELEDVVKANMNAINIFDLYLTFIHDIAREDRSGAGVADSTQHTAIRQAVQRSGGQTIATTYERHQRSG